ncbi:MAG: alpha-amylase family glycosyl hydrolase [Pseudomonadota bacterium]
MIGRLDWWRETTVYQIYPRSFMDGDGDGVGDLEGIIARLDHLADLGVETLWFSPFYGSPQRDVGYDISDYRTVAPEYGDMAVCRRLFDEIHARGMRVVLDMVLNHTSDQHPWFLASRSSRDDPKRDWFIWRDGRKPGGRAPPNNWHAMIGGSGWHYDPGTEQWYWAQFLPFQPDLNYRNPEVRAEMLDTLRFWMDQGADGFRLDIVNALFEDEAFRDNPFTWKLLPGDDDPSMMFQQSTRTLNHPDTLAFMRELRTVVDGHGDGGRFLVGEVNAPIEMARAHCGEAADGLHLVFLFKSLDAPLTAASIRRLVGEYEALFPEPYLPTWVFSNHDRVRRISRLGGDLERAKLNAAWQLTARGVPFLYYGEEIGMTQQRIPVSDTRDGFAQWVDKPQWVLDLVRRFAGESINRDECRTPMQWGPSPNAGFCPPDAAPWLPTPEDLGGRTVAEQQEDPESLLRCYRRFLAARRAHPALRRGSLVLLPEDATPRAVTGWRRLAEGRSVLVLLNPGGRMRTIENPANGGRFLVGTRTTRGPVDGSTIVLDAWECVVIEEGV